MLRASVVTALIVGAFLAAASGVAAHNGMAPYVIVNADFILPGQQFSVMVADIGEDAPVDFEIVMDARSETLGRTRAAPDGHLMTDLVLPADFPVGYAQLFATVQDVTSTSTWVLVGERTADTPAAAPAPAPTAAQWWTDPSVLVLGSFVVGAVGVIGYLVFKPRRNAPQPVTPAQPRRSTGKRAKR
jgi:hypothetical protein